MAEEKPHTFDKEKYNYLIWITSTSRVLLGPAIFVATLPATLITFLIDWADGEFFKRAGFPKRKYDIIDKVLDYYWYLFVLFFIMSYPVPQKLLFYSLFGIRTFGQIFYFVKRKEEYLFFFPNVFEILFYVYILSLVFPQLIAYLFLPKLIITLSVIIPLVLVREYILHIRKSNLSWFFTGVTTYWSEQK